MANDKQVERRIRAASVANAVNDIEGAPISDFAKELNRKWIKGELTHEDRHAILLERYRSKHI